METILGIKGEDFVMVAADCTQAHSIISLKEGKTILSIGISLFHQLIHLNLTKVSQKTLNNVQNKKKSL